MKKEKGITLIALIITIIIFLILAGISINVLTSNGLLNNARTSEMEYKKKTYFEEIELEIMTEQIERKTQVKEEAFIKSLQNRILKKDWVDIVIICDENLEEKEQAADNTVLIVNTKNKYEIIIDVNNSENIAQIRNDYFEKIEEENKYTIKYDANGGEGNSIPDQTIRKGFSITLQENPYVREGYTFLGWSEEETENSEIIYKPGDRFIPKQNTTLYAVWEKENIYILFDSNGGEGNMDRLEAVPDEEIELTANTFTKSGYIFKGWALNSDSTLVDYSDGQIVVFDSDKTLYAIWELVESYSIMTKDGIINGSNLAADALGKNAYDNNLNTYDSMLRDSNKYIYINNSVYNKDMTLYVSVGSTSDIAMYFYNDSNSIIKKYILYTSGKSTSSWSSTEKTLINSSQIVSYAIQIPENTYKIGFQMWDTSSTVRIYNIAIK